MAVNIVIVGLGAIAQEHLRIWRKMSKVTIAAVCDSNEQRAREAAKAWKIPVYYTDLNEVLEKQSISIVDICTPPQAHCSLILQALEAGCHVIVEKPLAMTAKEAKTIISAHKGSKAKVGIIHNWLFVPVMRRALPLVKKGNLGKLVSAQISIPSTQDDAMLANKDHWCHSLPGGRFGEMLAHPIYILQAILGQLEVKSVHAMKLGSYPWVGFDELRIDLEADESSASIYASFNCARDDAVIDIYGTKGILKINLDNDTMVRLKSRPLTILSKGMDSLQQASQVVSSTTRGALYKLSGRWIGGTELCLRAFVDSVLNDKEPLVSLEAAYYTVELLEQICRSIMAPITLATTPRNLNEKLNHYPSPHRCCWSSTAIP